MEFWGAPVLLALASALFFHFAHPPSGLWVLSFAGCLCLTTALVRSRSLVACMTCAFLAKATFSFMSFWYLRGVAPFVLVLYSVWPACLWSMFGAAFHGLRRHAGEFTAITAIPFLWVLWDFLAPRLHFLQTELCIWAAALGDSPLLRMAPYVGVYGVTFYAAAASVAPLLALRFWRNRPGRPAFPGTLLATFGLILPLLAVVATPAGSHRRARLRIATVASGPATTWDATAFDDETIPWTMARRAEFMHLADSLLDEIRRKLAGRQVDLVILPEDAIDVLLYRDRSKEVFERWGIENAGALIEAYRTFARKTGASLAVGLTTWRQDKPWNTVLLFDRAGTLAGSYDKVRLTAGSEYWPLASRFFPYWKWLNPGTKSGFVEYEEQYAPGVEPGRVLPLTLGPGTFRLGTPVCLEGHIPPLALRWKRRGAELLIYLSNASWFHLDPKAYNFQVLGLARMQSAAYAIPFAITGKLGLHGLVDQQGRPSVESGFEPGTSLAVAVRDLEFSTGQTTPAVQWGEYFVPASVAGVLLLLFLSFFRIHPQRPPRPPRHTS